VSENPKPSAPRIRPVNRCPGSARPNFRVDSGILPVRLISQKQTGTLPSFVPSITFHKSTNKKNMKKLAVLLAVSLLLFTASTYARTTDPTVPESINTEFSRDFSQAKDVKWDIGNQFFKATFDLQGRVVFAFYTDDADLIGIATNLRSDWLPRNLSAQIKKSYANYWITDLFKYKTGNEDGFVITLENSDKVVILKSEDAKEWNVYHVTNK
jgi:hypothetical protein